MSFRKWVFLLPAVVLMFGIVQVLVVAAVDSWQAQRNAELLSQGMVQDSAGSRAAVVYYFRSGHTALMAQRTAHRLHGSGCIGSRRQTTR
jgi:hypothetical protein